MPSKLDVPSIKFPDDMRMNGLHASWCRWLKVVAETTWLDIQTSKTSRKGIEWWMLYNPGSKNLIDTRGYDWVYVSS